MISSECCTDLTAAMDTIARRLADSRQGGRRPVLYLPGNAGRVVGVEQWIFDNPQRLRDVDVFQVLALGPAAGWEKAVLGGVGIVTPFIGPGVRQLVNAGLARNIRCNLSQVPRLFEDRWRPDVAIAHTSMPDEHGRVTLGLNAGIDFAPVSQARFKVALVNPQMPRWHIASCYDPASGRRMLTGCAMSLSDFDLVLEIDEPPIEHRMSASRDGGADETDEIAARIVDLLCGEAGATPGLQLPNVIQLGIGKIPNAVANALVNRGVSVKGVWSELFSDGVLRLYESGLIRRGDGPHLRDRIVVGFVLGSRELYRRMHDNPDFAVLPQEIVNDPALIKHNEGMTSINSAIAISLTGEVSAATIQRHYYSDVGGQFDFALGASWAHKGIAIIALPSVAKLRDGSLESKIVALHPEGAHHTIGADLPVVVVTEHGAADLRNLNDTERVEAMLGVVHPDWRDILTKEARALPSMQGVGAMPAHLIALKDGRHAVVRPAGKPDIGAISEYIERLSSDDRRTRYMGTISLGALTSADRLARLYHDSLDYLLHAAFIVDLEGEIIGVVHAFRLGETDNYEVSFSRRSDLHGQGIGSHLMQMLIEWGLSVGAQEFHATTYRSKNPRMRALFDSFGFIARPNPGDHETVAYSARLDALALVTGHPMND
ncbi:MAG: GNAT family N-acetyltransferase [Burkholderiales bacterium]|nr:GNAT family N-acetyltransferase [Burkholderiales bacterium]